MKEQKKSLSIDYIFAGEVFFYNLLVILNLYFIFLKANIGDTENH